MRSALVYFFLVLSTLAVVPTLNIRLNGNNGGSNRGDNSRRRGGGLGVKIGGSREEESVKLENNHTLDIFLSLKTTSLKKFKKNLCGPYYHTNWVLNEITKKVKIRK
jgi:hypothetical protein